MKGFELIKAEHSQCIKGKDCEVLVLAKEIEELKAALRGEKNESQRWHDSYLETKKELDQLRKKRTLNDLSIL